MEAGIQINRLSVTLPCEIPRVLEGGYFTGTLETFQQKDRLTDLLAE